jgi:hypothetical protein
MRVPDFLVRQFYVAGSLQHEGTGFRVKARNGMGDGTLVGIGKISASRDGDDTVHQATEVTPAGPVAFSRGDVVTFHIDDHALSEGEHRFEVEIYEVNLGLITLSLKDRVRNG